MIIPDDTFEGPGGPAFPHDVMVGHNGEKITYHGMSLRDYFAIQADADEIANAAGYLSVAAQEKLVGRPYPVKPQEGSGNIIQDMMTRNAEAALQYQVEAFRFRLEVSAKLRYMMSDAMLAAREAA